ncbi:hypothetical protein BH10PSE15_BH10PSE15_11590 [soil metagenome]
MTRAERPALAGDLLRYALALAGPILSAGAQFLLTLVLLRQLDPGSFGRFSFLLIVSQLGAGLWSALFCAPLPLMLSARRPAGGVDPARTMVSANVCGALLAIVPLVLLARAVGEGWQGAALFSGLAA